MKEQEIPILQEATAAILAAGTRIMELEALLANARRIAGENADTAVKMMMALRRAIADSCGGCGDCEPCRVLAGTEQAGSDPA